MGRVTRSQLYAMVWQAPLTQLAPGFGLSDNGLRKLCARFDIPVPPRGHWARSTAGKAVANTPLPPRDDDPQLPLPSERDVALNEERKQQSEFLKQAIAAEAPPEPVTLRASLVGAHPVLRNTERYFSDVAAAQERRRKEAEKPLRRGAPRFDVVPMVGRLNGRLAPTQPDCLRITATLKNITWILRFHDALIRALSREGCELQVRRWNESNIVEVHGRGARLELSFVEDFETVISSDPADRWNNKSYVAKDTYKLKLGSHTAPRKVWSGDQAVLVESLPKIAMEILAALAVQRQVEEVRQADEAARKAAADRRAEESRVWFEKQKVIADRKAARRAQVDRAMLVGQAHERILVLRRVVTELERRLQPDDLAVRQWLALVRPALVDPVDGLLGELRAEGEAQDRPLWWPDDDGSG